ncbi:MAG TPA: GlsB/YeaQ/YmgE family stress response membrane protein [Anaerolineales bacterium]|nr:GlsB/YeaQ/YmgE family stress response membrane protein [Anaerolineales bacterium]
MNILIYLIVAAAIGWLASEIMKDRASLLINIVVGIVGAFVAGYLISPLVGVPPISVGGAFNVSTLLVSLVGAVIVIWVVHLLRRRV